MMSDNLVLCGDICREYFFGCFISIFPEWSNNNDLELTFIVLALKISYRLIKLNCVTENFTMFLRVR